VTNHAHRRQAFDIAAEERSVSFWRRLRYFFEWVVGAGTGRTIPAAWAIRPYERASRYGRATRANRYRR
jgi:hypothetical protein